MSDYVSFKAAVEPLEWGKATYTILRLPPDVADVLEAEGAKRVEGEFNDHPVNRALTKAPVVDGLFLWAGKTLLDEAGIAPGEVIDVRLRKANPDEVDVPRDVVLAVRSDGVSEAWAALTPGKKRSLLYPIASAKRDTTRTNRIAFLVADLRGAN